MAKSVTKNIWQGVIPAVTTQFDRDLKIEMSKCAEHARWMLDSGCTGIVALGSLGEAAALELGEKRELLSTLVKAVEGRGPMIAGISALTTKEAVALARDAEAAGCAGLMVLPPYVYKGDWDEMRAHVAAILRATKLPCMLYNNPVAYGTDFLPEQIATLAGAHENLQAVKESSTDARRVTAIGALCGDRIKILVGVDDCVVEGVGVGAVGWIAGVTNALPRETVEMFEAVRRGDKEHAMALYQWLLPLLRMDTVPKFVQLIKLQQQEAGHGSEWVRPPRLVVSGAEREHALAIIHAALKTRPTPVAAG
ncbi:MAG TPA: dihydrodipicolinate synthase family protein [Terriglobales bacterium]|nr:dihydrodipicolinate synthase family protein [Terriglobales bacterium]